jgi:hypothetical protein
MLGTKMTSWKVLVVVVVLVALIGGMKLLFDMVEKNKGPKG